MELSVSPTLDRILVKPLEEEERIAGLEIVRDNRNAEMQTGIVLASGPQSPIKPGARIMYNPAAGTLVRFLKDGKYENCRIIHSDTVQCIFSEQ